MHIADLGVEGRKGVCIYNCTIGLCKENVLIGILICKTKIVKNKTEQ